VRRSIQSMLSLLAIGGLTSATAAQAQQTTLVRTSLQTWTTSWIWTAVPAPTEAVLLRLRPRPSHNLNSTLFLLAWGLASNGA
jgi:hypothetical protein